MKVDITKLPAYYMNIDAEVDRKVKTEAVLKSAGIESPTRVSAVAHPVKKLGCSASHHKILGNREVQVPFVVFEDDLVYSGAPLVYDIPDDADALYLGPTQWGRYMEHIGPFTHFKKTEYEGILRVYNMLMAHAIVYLNENFRDHCERIAKMASEGRHHIDQGFADAMRVYNVYTVDRPVFSQGGWNLQVTSDPLTETGIDIERSDEIYFVCKDDLGQLRGALDQTGVVKSRHYPMGYEGIGIDFKPGRLG